MSEQPDYREAAMMAVSNLCSVAGIISGAHAQALSEHFLENLHPACPCDDCRKVVFDSAITVVLAFSDMLTAAKHEGMALTITPIDSTVYEEISIAASKLFAGMKVINGEFVLPEID